MKQRILSSFMALVLCLSLLPTAAFAQDEDEGCAPSTDIAVCTCETVCTDTAMNTACPICGAESAQVTDCNLYTAADSEPETLPPEPDAAVTAVQRLVNALPAADVLDGMSMDELNALYEDVQAAGDAFDALTEEQQATLAAEESKLYELLAVINGYVQPTDSGSSVSYIEFSWNEKTKTLTSEAKAASGCTVVTSETTEWNAGWYVVSGDVTIGSRVTVAGDVKLILADNANLIVNGGIVVNGGNTFTVYAQSQPVFKTDGSLDETNTRTGKLTAQNVDKHNAGIGGNGGKIAIHGGVITATGGEYGAGIGRDNYYGTDRDISIYGGVITATGNYDGAGIAGNNITIHGGVITATGGDHGSGIGSGSVSEKVTVTIHGGTIIATGGSSTAGIGGDFTGKVGEISIHGGTVIATGGDFGAGIGSGYKGTESNITIHGGTVKATGGFFGAGIGGGHQSAGGKISIYGGEVTAASDGFGAGIGGGIEGAGGEITIRGGTIMATGGKYAAGIGGGNEGAGGEISFRGGTIMATGGSNACGIGSGYDGTGGEISIYGGQIKAVGGEPDSESDSNSDAIPTYAFSLVPTPKDNALCRLFTGNSLTSLTRVLELTDTIYTESKAVHIDADHDFILNSDDATTHICEKCDTVTAHSYIPNPDDETTHLCKGCGVKAKHAAPVLRADAARHTISCVCGDCLKEFGAFTLTAPTGSLTYDGNTKEAVVTGTIAGVATPEITYVLLAENEEETALSSAPVSAGTYRASIACGSGADAVSVSVTYTIDKATPTIQLSIEDWVAGSTPSTPNVTGNVGNGSEHFQYKGKNEDDSTYTDDVPTEVGAYTIRVTVSETENYTQASDTADFSILAVAAIVAIDGTITQYASFADALTYANAAAGTPTLTLLADCAQESAQTVSRSMILDLNGKELSGTTALTIAIGTELTLKGTTTGKLTAPLTVNGKLTVDDAVALSEVTVENYGNIVVNANATFGKLSFNGGTATLNSGTFTAIKVGADEKIKDKYFLGTDRGYYDTTDNKWLTDADLDEDTITNVSVKDAPIKGSEVDISVEMENNTFGNKLTLKATYYGNKSPSYQWYSISDDTATIISGETSSILTVIPDAGRHAYRCAITVDGYTLNQDTCSMLINPKKLTSDMIVLDDSQDAYDGAEKSVKFTIKDGTRTLELDRDYTVKSGDTATNVGHTLTIEGMGNYAGSTSKSWSLQKRTPEAADFTVNGLTATYDGTAKAVTATLNSPMTGAGDLTVYYEGSDDTTNTKSTTTPTCAGSYTVTLDVAEGTNFEAASDLSLGTLTISAATQTITSADNGRKTIIKNGVAVDISTWANSNAGDLAELTYTLVGTPAGITLSGTMLKAADADTTVGNFTIKVSAGAVDVNNDGTPEYSAAAEQTISVTVVDRQSAGVTIDTVSDKTYGDSFTVTASVDTGVTGGTWSWTTSDNSILEITSGADSATVTVEAKKADTTGAKLTVTYTSDTHYGTATTAAIPVAKKALTITGVSATERDYNGTTTVSLTGGELVGKVTGDDLSFILGTGTMSNANAGKNKPVTTSISLTGTAKDNYTLTQPDDITVTIRKVNPDYIVPTGLTATYGQTLADVDLTDHTGWSWMDDTLSVGDASDTAKNFKAAFTPTNTTNYNVMSNIDVPVTVGKAAPTAPTGLAGLKGNALSTVTLPDGWTWDNSATVMDETKEYPASYAGSANYDAMDSISVTVTVSDKQPQVLTVTMDGWTYGEAANTPQYTVPEGAASLTIQYKGEGTADSTYTATVPTNAGEYTVRISYETATEIWIGSADFTIAKITPTGEPKYTAITTSGKTLADAALTTEGSTFSVAGSVKWVGEDGNELTADTKVEVNKEYRWLFTPTDTDNYNTISGSIKLWSRASGGGGGSYTPSYTITVEQSTHGTISVSPKSAKSGETVTITVSPDKGYDLEKLTVLDKNGKELSLTNNSGGRYTFKMPASAVTVKAVFAAERMENPFVDVSSGAYYENAVLWALKNGVTGGIDKNHFGPDLDCTRAQLVTFLWRAAGSPVVSYTMDFTDVGNSYYTEAVRWAASLGIVGGYGNGLFGTEDTITREQMATILYRFAQSVGMDTANGGTAVREFADYESISGYASEAMQWAVSAGILQGYNNRLMPSQPCTRAQIVTMLYRLLGE